MYRNCMAATARVLLVLMLIGSLSVAANPKMIAYSAPPNAYFDDHAQEAAKLYDGFFFVAGSWDNGVRDNLGVPGEAQPASDWRTRVTSNVQHLRAAGATENLLGVYFDENGEWPSAATLLNPEYIAKMSRCFGALGQAAKEMQFRGVSIDLEYPYKRYRLDHPSYTYDSYSADDLMTAAAAQGRAAMIALLDAFPEVVIWTLPGELGGSEIGGAFFHSMLQVMAERDAPGGLHLGYERSYCLLDPASQVAIPRVGDCMAEIALAPKTLAYWKKRCSVAPGVWPLHQVETGGPNYPKRPWAEELKELRQQMSTLRATAKRYTWSYSGQPVWCLASAEIAAKYGISQTFEGADEAVRGWHQILQDRTAPTDPRLSKLTEIVAAYDRGEFDGKEFCARFGAPPDWKILGFLDNPNTRKAFTAPGAWKTTDFLQPVQGRDGAVHWFTFQNREPLGNIRLRPAFGDRATDYCSVHLVCTVSAAKETPCYLWLNWDDGAVVRLNDQVVIDQSNYPERGHGLLFQDRFLFEAHVPIVIPAGTNRLSVTSYNAFGNWGLNLRIADENAFPVEGLRFGVPE